MAGKGSAGMPIWLVQQHDQFSIEESKEIPSTKVEPGQRMKAVFGPYGSKAEAEQVKKTLEGRTLRGKQEGRR